jgi:hypothetical protein
MNIKIFKYRAKSERRGHREIRFTKNPEPYRWFRRVIETFARILPGNIHFSANLNCEH